MGFKTIRRNEISGQHEPVEAQLGKGNDYGRNEIIAREKARQAELEAAIGKDSDGSMVSMQNEQDHPALKSSLSRFHNEPARNDVAGLGKKHYNAIHNDDPNAEQEDTFHDYREQPKEFTDKPSPDGGFFADGYGQSVKATKAVKR